MWNFFNRPAKQKADKWLEICDWSCLSWSKVSTKCLWWQNLLLLFICLIVCSCAHTDRPLSASSTHTQKIYARHRPHTVLERLHFSDMQHSANPIHFWKNLSKTLNKPSMPDRHRPSLSFQKQYRQRGLFKRELENPSQNNSASVSEWTSTLNEIIRTIFGGNTLSLWSGTVDRKSAVSDVSSSPSSNFQLEPLGNGNFLRKDIPLDHDVVEAEPSSKSNILINQEMQMPSTLKYSITSNPEDMSSVHSLNEQESTTKFESTAKSSEWSVTTLPFLGTQSFQYSKGTHTEKSMTYTDWKGDHSPVTDVPKISNANSSSYFVDLISLPVLTNLNNGYTKIASNVKSVTKTISTMEQHIDLVKATNENSDLSLEIPGHPNFQTSTINNSLTSSFEATTVSPQYGEVSVTVKSQTSLSMVKPTMTVYASTYPSDMKSSLTTPLLDSPSIFTSLYLQKQDDQELTPFTLESLSISGLPSTRETLEITSSFNPDHNADVHQMISTEGRIETSSSVKDGTPTNTLFALYNQTAQVKHSSPTTPVTNLHVSNIAQMTEHDPNLHEKIYTLRPQSITTWSTPKKVGSTENNHMSSDAVSFQMDYKTTSSITPGPYGACVLQTYDAVTTETSLKSSETSHFPTTIELTTFETDKIGSLTSKNVTLFHHLKPNDENTFAETTFTDGYTPEPTEFPSTVTLSTFESDIFNDAVNGNDNLNKSTINLTSTLSSTISPAWLSKSVTSITPRRKSQASQQFSSTVSVSHKQEQSPSSLYRTEVSNVSASSHVTTGPTIPFSHPSVSDVSLPARTEQESPYSSPMPTVMQQTAFTKSMAALEASLPAKTSSYHPNMTTHRLSTMLFPSGSDVSLPARTEQESPYSSPMPTVMQQTAFTKSLAALEASLLAKASSYHPYMTTHRLSTMLLSTEKDMTLQKTTATPSQVHTISHMSTKSSIFSGSYFTPKTQAGPSTRTMKSVSHLLFSTLKTSSQPSVFTMFQSRNETTVTHTSSSLKPTQTSPTPAPKLWIPQSSADFPPKPTSSVTSINDSLTPVVTMPLNFHLTGILYSPQLSNRITDEYKRLEREVKLVMNKIFSSKYQQEYVQTEILEILSGSVIVRSNVLFHSHLPTPSGSDVVRTVLSDVYVTKKNYFGWNINGSTVESKGYTQKNLELESLPISLRVLRVGFIAVAQKHQEKQGFLENLQKEVFQAINVSFPIAKISISQIRDVHGDLEVRGNLYLNSLVSTNVQSLLSTLLPLLNRSVDVGSITVDGMRSELQVHSINFRVTNKPFVVNLLDMSSSESQILSKDLSTAVQSVLLDRNPLQVIIREFKSGSVVCRGDLLYRLPAPSSGEVLRILLLALGSDGSLGSSPYKVDSKSVTVGGSSPGPNNEYIDFPGFGVAIIVMCGLSILIFPALVYLCYKTRMLGHRNKATIQRDPDNQSHHFEMDNRAFRASIEQP